MLGFALFAVQTIEQGTEVFDFAAQGEHAHLFVAQSTFEIFELAEDFAQFTLHREWAFRALFASGNGDVVEALAGLGKEEGVGIFESQAAGHVGFGNDVAVAQLGQDDFQRFAEAIQHADCVFQGNDLRRGGAQCAASSTMKENLACESSGWTRKVARPSTPVRSMRRPSSAASQDFTTT